MSMSSSLLDFLETVHPGRYRRMTERLWGQLLRLFFFVLGLSLVLFILVGSVMTIVRADTLKERLSSFDHLSLSFDGKVAGQHELVTRPQVIIDTNASSAKGAKVVFGQDKIYYKKYYFVGNDYLSYEDIKSFSQISDNLKSVLIAITLLLLPGLALAVGVLSVVAVLLLSLLFAFIGWNIFNRKGGKDGKRALKFRAVLMTAIHASMIPLFVFIVLLPIINLFYLCLLAYVLLFGFALYLQKDHEFKSFDL